MALYIAPLVVLQSRQRLFPLMEITQNHCYEATTISQWKITEKTFISIFLIYIFWCNNGMGQCQSNVSVLVNFKITYCLRICQHHPLPRTDLHTDDPTTGCILIRQSRVTLVKTEPPPSTAQAGAGHCFSWWELFSHSSLHHAYVWMVSG